jgi:hypothetical protein
VRGIDCASWNNNRPPGVAIGFQVSKHLVEAQGDVTSNILSNDPSGSDFANNSAHFRPEVTVIRFACAPPGVTERLTGVSSTDEFDSSDSILIQSICCKGSYIVIAGDSGPVFCEDGAAVGVDLAERDSSHSGSLKSETEPADSAE